MVRWERDVSDSVLLNVDWMFDIDTRPESNEVLGRGTVVTVSSIKIASCGAEHFFSLTFVNFLNLNRIVLKRNTRK